jgi:diguanylate cyclase (GGDEF)-like protein
MHGRLPVRWFAAAVFAGSCGLLVALAPSMGLGYVVSHPVAFGFLSVGVVLAELLPIKIPRRGGDEEITISTSFSFGLLLVGGLGPAVLTLAAASVIQDLAVRKPWWRIRFNVGQYSLSMAAATLVLKASSSAPHVGLSRPFSTEELPLVRLAAAVFFAVNTAIVGTAVALYQGAPIGRYFRNDLVFIAISGGVVLCVAPIVAVAVVYSVALVPLFLLPMLAIYRAGKEASRSEHAAHHDALTGLPNRVTFHNVVTDALAEKDTRSCVLLMDLNRFKDVNDTLGHRYGDLLLQGIADRLQERLGRDHALARLGGDEFAIFSRTSDVNQALEFAESVASVVRTSFELEQFVVDTEASVGIALFPDHGADLETLLQKADVAMYQAKESQTGVALYDESFDHHSPARLALTGDLRAALTRDEIVVWYQPLLDLASETVPTVEALVRWEHPDLGLLLPGSFLEMAEHTSLIKPLTQKVLDTALSQVAQWRKMGIEVTVAVNISTRILADHDFTDSVLSSLARAGVSASRLKLEVTESSLMADPVVARSTLQELDRLGVEISIDDFGTGYSSLAYLTELPVSEVKIDRSFVTRMAPGSREAVIVTSTIDLGHHLGLRVVAEGVEDAATLEQLRALNCDLIQGYHVGRPVPAEQATSRLLDSQYPSNSTTPTVWQAA